jgi:hypothetical protein
MSLFGSYDLHSRPDLVDHVASPILVAEAEAVPMLYFCCYDQHNSVDHMDHTASPIPGAKALPEVPVGRELHLLTRVVLTSC